MYRHIIKNLSIYHYYLAFSDLTNSYFIIIEYGLERSNKFLNYERRVIVGGGRFTMRKESYEDFQYILSQSSHFFDAEKVYDLYSSLFNFLLYLERKILVNSDKIVNYL